MDMLEALPILRKLAAHHLRDTHDFARAATELADAITGRDIANAELGRMLRELADTGWKPLLYFDDGENGGPRSRQSPAWVSYPQGDVRVWGSFRAPDPVGAVRLLYQHAREYPNVPPCFLPAPAPAQETATPASAQTAAPPAPPQPAGRPRPVHEPLEITRMGAALGCIVAFYVLLALLVRAW